MTNIPPTASSDDPEVLADGVAGNHSPRECEAAFLRLRPYIERQVRRVCVRFSGQARPDLNKKAVAVVREAMNRFQVGRPFEPWCRAVLKDFLIDALRHISREQ